MTKQEFMAMSLDKGLIIQFENENFLLDGMHGDRCMLDYNDVGSYFESTAYCNPVLRSLSDLTKEVEHNGETFFPFDYLLNQYDDDYFADTDYEAYLYEFIRKEFTSHHLKYLHFGLIKQLIEWHFDIAGLIEKGEAIDVNALETNPYK